MTELDADAPSVLDTAVAELFGLLKNGRCRSMGAAFLEVDSAVLDGEAEVAVALARSLGRCMNGACGVSSPAP